MQNNFNGIIAYSLFQLPKDLEMRTKFLEQMIKKKIFFVSAIEGIFIKNKFDIKEMNKLWKRKETLPLLVQYTYTIVTIDKFLVKKLHTSTSRNYLQRMLDDKIKCMKIASKFEKDYWDGDRRYGYGGYKYIKNKWRDVAKKLIKTYKLNNKSKILDVGCGNGCLLYGNQKNIKWD